MQENTYTVFRFKDRNFARKEIRLDGLFV